MDQNRRPTRPDDLVIDIIEPAMKVGAVCGGVGFLVGGAFGIVRGAPPILFAGASAVQVFALGTTFSGIRSGLIQTCTTKERSPTPRNLTAASAVAGGVTGGAIGFITRGRSNAIPGMLMFTIFGAAGQIIHNRFTGLKTTDTSSMKDFWKRMSEKNWSPVKMMSNEEYTDVLREKMLKLDVEIAVLDDNIAALKVRQNSEQAARNNEAATER